MTFKKYNISLPNMQSNYFHFTSISNLESIRTNGLLPHIGKHAKYIEKTKKVFS